MDLLTTTAVLFIASGSAGPELTDVATIVARHLDACGGAVRLRAVSSVREVGTITLVDATASSTGAALLEEKRPNNSRAERTIHGVPMVWAYDGATAWTMRGSGTPEVLSGEMARNLAANEFDHFLLDYRSRGIDVALAGVAEIGSRPIGSKPAYKLKVTLRDGAVRYSYIDKQSFLEVRRDYLEKDGTSSQQAFRGHKTIDGVTRPMVYETVYPGTSRRILVTVERAEVNPQIDDARFRMPKP